MNVIIIIILTSCISNVHLYYILVPIEIYDKFICQERMYKNACNIMLIVQVMSLLLVSTCYAYSYILFT